MLPRSTHHQVAYQQSPERERLLAWYVSGNAQGATGQTDDDDGVSGLERDLFSQRAEELESVGGKGKVGKKTTIDSAAISQTRTQVKREALSHIPHSLLTQYTVGTYHLLDTMYDVMDRKQINKLAAKYGIGNVDEVGNFDALLDKALSKTSNAQSVVEGLSPEDTTKLIRRMQEQLQRMKKLQSAVIDRTQQRTMLSPASLSRIEARANIAQKDGKNFEEWLQNQATEQDIVLLLGIEDQHLLRLYQDQPDKLKAFILASQDFHQESLSWLASYIERNPHLEGKDLRELQSTLNSDLEKVLPTLSEILKEKVQQEANATRTWLDAQRAWYETQRNKYNTTDLDALDEAFLSSDIKISASAIEREIAQTSLSIHRMDSGAFDEAMLQRAPEYIDHLRSLRQKPNGEARSIADGLHGQQEATQEWANMQVHHLDEILNRYRSSEEQEKLQNIWGNDIIANLQRLHTDFKRPHVNAYYYDTRTQNRIGSFIATLLDPYAVDDLQSEREAAATADVVDAGQQQVREALNISREVESIRLRVSSAVGTLVSVPAASTGIMKQLGFDRQMLQRGMQLEQYLDKIAAGTETRITIADVNREIEKIEKAADLLAEINQQNRSSYVVDFETTDAFYAATKSRARAFYSYKDRKIYIDKQKCSTPDQYAHTLEEEEAHKKFDVAMRGDPARGIAPVAPFFVRSRTNSIRTANGQYDQLLAERTERWRAGDMDGFTDEQLQSIVAEEALVKRWIASKKQRQDPGFRIESDPDYAVYQAIDQTNFLEEMDSDSLFSQGPGEREGITEGRIYDDDDGMVDDDDEGGDVAVDEPPDMGGGDGGGMGGFGGEGEEEDPEAITEKLDDTRDELLAISKKILLMREFAKKNPQYKGNLGERIEQYQRAHDLLDRVYTKRRIGSKRIENPEEHEGFQKVLNNLKSETQHALDKIGKLDLQIRDVNSEVPTGKGISGFLKSVRWYSLLDFYLMGKDVVDDVKRIYERRSRQKRGELGQGLFGWLPQDIPYLGRLDSEFERRKEEAENEEVDVWKKALETKDAYELMDILADSNNTDQVKAIMTLLSEKGRIEWDDIRLWKVLNRMSRYSMPYAPCKRDQILRDNWLKKLITDIWDDKDLYLGWKGGNDSAFDSGKEKFTQVVDTLSQTEGGMKNELANQLKIFVEYRKAGKTLPEFVNPHLYEETLTFAMEKGKMSMEQKFYFLIRGIAEGIMPIERLNIINNKVLGSFPFIDYFSQQNNTIAEIKALSDRIKESDDPYVPGIKTTLFLQFEVARDENARSRVYKRIAHAGDTIDHEDMPMMTAFMDYGSWEEMLKPMGGQKQRLTTEGIKNSYIGFNTVFRTYAILAELDKEGIRRFTKDDASNLARKVTAFLHFDNIVTGKATDKYNRPEITWAQINQEYMPSDGLSAGSHPKEYRDRMTTFTQRLVQDYGLSSRTIGGVSMNEYIPSAESDNAVFDDDKKKQIFKVTKQFMKIIEKKIIDDPSKFMNILIGHNNSGPTTQFLNEGVPINLQDVRQFLSH